MASFLSGGDDEDAAALYTLAYFTSDWVQPLDELLLPRVRTVLRGVNSLNPKHELVGLLQVRRVNNDGEQRSTEAHEQRLEPSTFRELCRHFQVTDLPAVVLLDAQGQAQSKGSLEALESELHYLQDGSAENDASNSSYSPWRVVGELLSDQRVLGAAWEALQPLWRVVDETEMPTLTEVDDPALVQMREAAAKKFEVGEFIFAATNFVSVLLRCPTCTKSSFNLAVILQTIGETYFAVSCMLRVVALDDSDSVAQTVLRSVYYLEEPGLVRAGYHSILAQSESHVRAKHSLATIEGATTTQTAAPEYVAEVFDELAGRFEEKLVAHLEYRVPWQLVDALQNLAPPGFVGKDSTEEPMWSVVDVGCGTGLCGRLLRPHVKHITGVDISPLMIEKTRAAGSYDELQTAEIVAFLKSRDDGSLDLIISADVWIYVGALEEVFSVSAQKLRAVTGWFAFSVELIPLSDSKDTEGSPLGFRLAPSGRFQHSHEYIASLAKRCGFAIVVQQDISVRKESGEPIPGRIYHLQQRSS